MKKRNIRGFFVGEKGQRTFNYAYSIGASVVILGALFKLLHVPGADPLLILGMGTEAVIFFLSAFDEPAKDYKWEKVYPELELPNDEEAALARLERIKEGGSSVKGGSPASVTIIGGGTSASGPIVMGGGNMSAGTPASVGTPVISGGTFSAVQADEVAAATTQYVNQLSELSQSLAKLQESLSVLQKAETNFSQMADLNRDVQGLSTIYELQLKSVSAQLGTIGQVGQETEQLVRNLQQLNEVYTRMIAAMTASQNR